MREQIDKDAVKTIAILTGSFPPTNIVGSLRPYRLAKCLCRRGWRTIVFTNPPNPGSALDHSLLQELPENHQIHYVSRLRDKGFWERGIPARIVGTGRDFLAKCVVPDLDVVYVPSFCKAFRDILGKMRIDVLLTTSPPHSIHLAGLWLSKSYGLPWVVDFRDPWDNYHLKGHYRIDHPLERYMEEKVVNNADVVISTTRFYSQNLMERHPDMTSEKFRIITNTFDRVKTAQKIEKDPEFFVICYTGIFYPQKDPYGFFRALRSWFDHMSLEDMRKYRSRLRVHLIGSSDRITRGVIHDLGLEENVIFFERMSHEKAILKTLSADMVLISTGIGERTMPGWLPSKLFEYLGCRIPILALIREGEMAEIIRETNSGYVLTKEDHNRIEKILKKEINVKFGAGVCTSGYPFTFAGIERFEEENVMMEFVSVIESTLPLANGEKTFSNIR